MEVPSVKEPVLLMARYNLWANTRFVAFYGKHSPEILHTEVPGSFPSLSKTLVHISDAQDIWYRRLHGESPTAFLSSTWSGEPDELYSGLIDSSEAFVKLTSNMSPSDLAEVIDYKTMAGGPQSSKRYEVLLHVFNHSMYHRGQCVTMARTLHLEEIPSTDLVKYLREA